MNKTLSILIIIVTSLFADEVYNKNKKANKLYEQGKYAEALSIYEKALLESPGNKKLSMNKGSAQYKLQQFDKAEESYKNALSIENQKARAELLYNMGNVLNMQGDQLAQQGNQEAMEKYKAAKESYIKALEIEPSDMDAKWNLEITQQKIKKQKQQQEKQKGGDKDIKPSEYAKKIKAQADKLVAIRKYTQAHNLMMDLLKKDKTGMAYKQYIKRLKDVTEINKI